MAASTLFDNSPEYSGKTVFSPWSGFGVPVEDFPLGSVMDNDIQLPAMAGMEARAQVLTKPAGGTVSMDSYGRVTATGLPDGAHAGTYTFFLDGVAQGDGTYTINVGASVTNAALSSADSADSVSSFVSNAPAAASLSSSDGQDAAAMTSSVQGAASLSSIDEQDVIGFAGFGGTVESTDSQDAVSMTSESASSVSSAVYCTDWQDEAFMHALVWNVGLPANYYIARV